MSIKHGLLALLVHEPRYGARLRTEFEQQTGGTWPLNIGQVYTTLDRLERERSLVPREAVRSALGRVAALLRSAGDALGTQFGPVATDLLYEALDDAGREVERSFGGGGGDDRGVDGDDEATREDTPTDGQ